MSAEHRNILVTYGSQHDDAALEQAVALASAHRARLTIAVPVERPWALSALCAVDVAALRGHLEEHASALARHAAARVPDDISVVIRCVPRECERSLAGELGRGAYDLLIGRAGRRWRRPLGLRLAREAARVQVTTLLLPLEGPQALEAGTT